MGLAEQMIEYIVHGEETPEEISRLPKVTSHLPRPCNVQPLGCVTKYSSRLAPPLDLGQGQAMIRKTHLETKS